MRRALQIEIGLTLKISNACNKSQDQRIIDVEKVDYLT